MLPQRLFYYWSVDNLNEKVKAVPFVPKVTITFLRLPRSINFYSGKERGKKKGERNKNHNIIMKLEKKKKKGTLHIGPW